jgi:hypothetical protein
LQTFNLESHCRIVCFAYDTPSLTGPRSYGSLIRRRPVGADGPFDPPPGPPQAAIPPELALDRTLPIDPAVKTGRLPNGLRYFIRENKRPANRVSMRLAVNAGAIQEDPDQRGLAHFIEHMAFNGTEHFKPGELVSFLESIGALRTARERIDVLR